jgi:FkbM family methyltransferase
MSALGIDLVIDVGANRGQFGLEIRRAGFGGRIVSIEPLADAHRHLARMAARDERWTVIQSAVGPAAGRATIHVAANAGASSSFLPMLELHNRAAPSARYIAEESVEVGVLDELVSSQVGRDDIILTKIDVQGYELQVLAGGPVTLARSSLVQLEMSLLPLYEGAPTFEGVLEFMGRHGFRLVGIEPGFADRTGVLLQADGIFAAQHVIRSLQGGGR